MISPSTDSAINIPAVAAALVTKPFQASDFDELDLKVCTCQLFYETNFSYLTGWAFETTQSNSRFAGRPRPTRISAFRIFVF